MRIRALGNINSGQFNAGDEFDLDDVAARQLIEAGAAEAVDSNGRNEEAVSGETTETVPLESSEITVSEDTAPETPSPTVEPTPPQPAAQPEALPTPPAPEASAPSQAEVEQVISEVEQSTSSTDLPPIS